MPIESSMNSQSKEKAPSAFESIKQKYQTIPGEKIDGYKNYILKSIESVENSSSYTDEEKAKVIDIIDKMAAGEKIEGDNNPINIRDWLEKKINAKDQAIDSDTPDNYWEVNDGEIISLIAQQAVKKYNESNPGDRLPE